MTARTPSAPPLQDAVRRRALKVRMFGVAGPVPTLGRYSLEGMLGEGAMGVVYRGHDARLGRTVAIKVLRAAVGSGVDRLEREARVLAKLSHPNVVTVHEVGDQDGHTFIAMEYVSGRTLRDWMADEHSAERRVAVIRQAAEGLAAAHAVGLIHRDFKPDNAIVGEDGRVRLLDFGLATTPAELDSHPPTPASSGRQGRITQTGVVLGTPAYLAPEVAAGAPATAKSDQFALCCTAWEVFFGHHPFAASAMLPEAPSSSISKAAVAAVRRGLQTEPNARHPTVAALLDAMPGGQPRRRPWAAVAATAAVGAVAVGVVASQPRPRDEPPVPEQTAASAELDCSVSPPFSDARRALVDNARLASDELADLPPTSAAARQTRWRRAGAHLALGRWDEACNELTDISTDYPTATCWTRLYCESPSSLPRRARCFAGEIEACVHAAIKHEYEYLDAKNAMADSDDPLAGAAAQLHYGYLVELLVAACEGGHGESCETLARVRASAKR